MEYANLKEKKSSQEESMILGGFLDIGPKQHKNNTPFYVVGKQHTLGSGKSKGEKRKKKDEGNNHKIMTGDSQGGGQQTHKIKRGTDLHELHT